MRRQSLWRECYAAVARKDHPRLQGSASLEAFVREKHALVSAVGTGHEHLAAERILQALIPGENIVCTVPTFVAAAHIAKHSDVIVTLPRTLAESSARDLDLQFIVPPIALPPLEIAQYWHDRFHRDAGHQWFRSLMWKLFSRERGMHPIES
jgi:DNA-binding transcriptional LysR family regulator